MMRQLNCLIDNINIQHVLNHKSRLAMLQLIGLRQKSQLQHSLINFHSFDNVFSPPALKLVLWMMTDDFKIIMK